MSPCDEYKKLVKEWQTARGQERYWRPENPDTAEKFREQADNLKTAMEEHVKVCVACKNS